MPSGEWLFEKMNRKLSRNGVVGNDRADEHCLPIGVHSMRGEHML
jgi:hypothetical protein